MMSNFAQEATGQATSIHDNGGDAWKGWVKTFWVCLFLWLTSVWATSDATAQTPGDCGIQFELAGVQLTSVTVEETTYEIGDGGLLIEPLVQKGDEITVRGKVTKEDGTPDANADVGIYDHLRLFSSVVSTDSQGEFEYQTSVSSATIRGPRSIRFIGLNNTIGAIINFQVGLPPVEWPINNIEGTVVPDVNNTVQVDDLKIDDLTVTIDGGDFAESEDDLIAPISQDETSKIYNINCPEDVNELNYKYVLRQTSLSGTNPWTNQPGVLDRALEIGVEQSRTFVDERVEDLATSVKKSAPGVATGLIIVGGFALCKPTAGVGCIVAAKVGKGAAISTSVKTAGQFLLESSDAPEDATNAWQTGTSIAFLVNDFASAESYSEFLALDFGPEIGDKAFELVVTENQMKRTLRLMADAKRAADGETANPFSDVVVSTVASTVPGVRVLRFAFEYNGIRKELLAAVKTEPETQSSADIALVLDRSGSMFGNPIQAAKTASTNFINLLQNGDGVSVASFNSGARVDFPFTRIQSESDRESARSAISAINAGGGTNIGAGINAGLGELPSNTSEIQGMVLLSDGFGSVGNAISNVPENVNIYTIALGPNSDQDLLNDIASQTGGFFRLAPTESELQGIYDDIRTQVTGQQTIASTSGTISQGQQTSTQAQVDNSTNRSFFSVLWPGSDIDLTLEDPNGRVIDPSTAESDPNISFSSGSTFETYTVDNPVPGTWNLTIVGTDIPDGGEPYTLSASGDSDLTMDIAFDKPSYPLGENIFVSATITDGEAAVTGADVTAEVTTPSQKSATAMHAAAKGHAASADAQKGQNAVQLSKKGAAYVDENGAVYYRKAEEGLKLYDDGLHGDGGADDGVYANFFSGTNTGGSYTFDITASGTAPNSGDFTREGSRSTVVSSSAPTANCPGTLGITDFDADQSGSPDTGEFVEIVNTGPSPASLDGCTLVFFDGANSSSYFAMDLQGSIGPGSIFTAGNAGAGDVAQMFPDNTLQNGPDAMALYRDDATNFPEGTPVTVENLVSAVVYIDDDNVFGTTESSSKKLSTPEEVLMLLNDIDRLMKPEAFVLDQNYPNPFTGRTTIRYSLPEAAEVELIVYDVLGRQVRRLVDERKRAGNHEVVWNGRDVSGNPLASGVYFYRLKAGEFADTRSVRIVR